MSEKTITTETTYRQCDTEDCAHHAHVQCFICGADMCIVHMQTAVWIGTEWEGNHSCRKCWNGGVEEATEAVAAIKKRAEADAEAVRDACLKAMRGQ